MRILRCRVERRFIRCGIVVADGDPRLHCVRSQAVVGQLQRGDVVGTTNRLINRFAIFLDESPIVAEVGPDFVMDQLTAP